MVERFIVTWVALAAVAAPSAAHHSFAAQYDREKPITLTGVVTRVDWVNPHVYFYMNVTGESGETAEWALENGHVNGLLRAGWRRDSLEPGDAVTVEGFLARDGTNLANAQKVTLADGRTVFGASGNYPTR